MWWLKLPLIIDEATPDDIAALSDIHGAAFQRTWSEDEIAALLRDEAVTVLVARRSSLFSTKTPVGFVMIRQAVDEAEILTIAVSGGYRRRGIGRSLVESLLRRLYAERIKRLFLEVDIGNTPAVTLYRRLGFKEVGERPGYYASETGARSAALVMRRELG